MSTVAFTCQQLLCQNKQMRRILLYLDPQLCEVVVLKKRCQTLCTSHQNQDLHQKQFALIIPTPFKYLSGKTRQKVRNPAGIY
mgnify:CR=1 FL=1